MSEVVSPAPAWQEVIFQSLKHAGVRQVAYVPDAGHAHEPQAVGDAQIRGHRHRRPRHRVLDAEIVEGRLAGAANAGERRGH